LDQQLASARAQVSGFQATTVGQGLSSGPSEARYQALFEEAGQRHDIDPALLAAIASVESGFDPTAQSSAGAQGLMQFMPATASEMGVDPFDPASAIDGAARYLKREIQRFGSVELAAAAYNAGAGAVSRHGGVPPFTETQNYVKKVLSAYEARR
jgi:soluble lytic murein transglycosylase-like protein